jgi:preprotein translocase subunit YajC
MLRAPRPHGIIRGLLGPRRLAGTDPQEQTMDFLISSAHAQAAAPAAAPNPLMSFLPLIILFAVFYFLLIRPQMKRAKEQRAMIAALAKGDEVLTNGGIVGRIVELGDPFLGIEIASGVTIKAQKQAIAQVLPKGTLKAT